MNETDDCTHQENTVNAAIAELRLVAGLSFDQMLVVRNYLHYLYQTGYNRYKLKNGANVPVHKIKNGIVLATYVSITEAARKTPGTSVKSISKVLNGINNTSGGFFWKRAEKGG